MKKFKFLFVMLIGILLIPCTVFAADTDTSEDASSDEKVNVYFFYGNGCGYCANAEEFFDDLKEDYGDQFNLVMYETWYDEDNANLMEKVADARKEEVEGVPYIIIGNQSWNGYDSSYDEEIISKIESEYKTEPDERYDIMNYVDDIDLSGAATSTNSYAGDIAVVIAIVLVVAAVGGGIWYARKKAA